jgi:hypothetical protein
MKITCLSVNCSYSHTSLAFPFIQSYADPKNLHHWQLVECTIKENITQILTDLLSTTPDLLLVSCYIFNRPTVQSIITRFRAIKPEIKIIAGGPEFLGDNEPFLRDKIYDIIIRGEGEIPFKALLQQNLNPLNIHGCCFIDTHHNYIDQGISQEIEQLDTIPSPYQNNLVNQQKPFVQYETTRGCPNSCSFCTSSLSKQVRYYSHERVMNDLKHFAENRVTDLRILDRTFNCNPKRAIKLLQCFRLQFPQIHIHAEFDPAFMTKELLEELKQANPGQLHLETGVQAFSTDTYTAVARKSTIERTKQGLKALCNLKNIEVHADLIAGLPKVTLDSLYNDLIELFNYAPAEIQLELLKLLPGTPTSLDQTIIGATEPPYEILQNPQMSYHNLLTAAEWSKIIDGYYNQKQLKNGFLHYVLEDRNFLKEFHTFLKQNNAFLTPLSLEKRMHLLNQHLLNHPEKSRENLLISWFQSGYSPEHGIFPAKVWYGEIPKTYKILVGIPIKPHHHKAFHYQTKTLEYIITYSKGAFKNPQTKITIYKKEL